MAFRTDGEEQASDAWSSAGSRLTPILGTSNELGHDDNFYHVSVLQQIDQ